MDDDFKIDSSKYDGPWSFQNETIFIDLMEEEVEKGNRPTTTFTRTSWTYMKERLLAKTGYNYSHEQLKNKYNSLRQVYKDFTRLLHDVSEKGWDPVSGTITLKQEQWNNLIKVNKKARKFKKSGCPHYQKLMRIYGDTTRTNFHALPLTKIPSYFEDENESESESDVPISRSEDCGRDENEGQSSMSKKSKRKRECLNDTFMEAYVEKKITDIVEKKLVGFSSSKGKDFVDGDLKKCFEILNNMVDIDDKAYTKMLKHLVGDTTWRQAFLCIPESRRRGFINNL